MNISKDYIHTRGQYFTTNNYLKECVYSLIHNDPSVILEPSMGQGDLVEYVKSKKNVMFDLYELDTTITILPTIDKNKIIYGDFLQQEITTSYTTIIGNPPYVKTKKGNLYLDFIQKCFNLLENKGELIFIVPSDFIKLTSASKLIIDMLQKGTFTDIIHPNQENLFSKASIDIIIFRYCKDPSLPNKIVVNNKNKYLIQSNGIVTFSDIDQSNHVRLGDYFDICVGMVTGKEKVYKNSELGNIKVLNGKNKVDDYILIDTFPTDNIALNTYMNTHKDTLITRKIRKFNKKNWFEWGALRNYAKIKKNIDKDCIYVCNITRSKEVCFKGKVQYFGGRLILMIPKQKINIDNIITYIKSDICKSNYMYAGRFKIGHKQLCNLLIDPSYVN